MAVHICLVSKATVVTGASISGIMLMAGFSICKIFVPSYCLPIDRLDVYFLFKFYNSNQEYTLLNNGSVF
jgi:hypothetical protein